MIVGIQQPNYIPWTGYFYKIYASDKFVFLDDVQYTKNNYINRVKIISSKPDGQWLTIPVSYHFKDIIQIVRPAKKGWVDQHLNMLRHNYRNSKYFSLIWSDVVDLYKEVYALNSLSDINIKLIIGISDRLGIKTDFIKSSELLSINGTGGDRLIEILKSFNDNSPQYLSGSGGAKYQDEEKFKVENIGLKYTDFVCPTYQQGIDGFTSGLSVLDMVFATGWERSYELISNKKMK